MDIIEWLSSVTHRVFVCVNALIVSVTKCWMMLVRNLLGFFSICSVKRCGWERSPAHFMRTNDYLFLLLGVKPLQNVLTLLQKCFVPKNENISLLGVACLLSNTKQYKVYHLHGTLQVPYPWISTPVSVSFCRRLSLKSMSYKGPHPAGIVSQETAIWGFPSLPTRRSWLRIGG